MPSFVSRAGQKLDHALATFGLDVRGWVCADLGANAGGFVDCLLQRGAAKVYAVDTGYGMLEYKLRKDPRVIVMERTNAMHVTLPEPVDLVTIDVAWTRQKHILPAAARLLRPATADTPGGQVVTLVKPHYEAERSLLRHGILPEADLQSVLKGVADDIQAAGFRIADQTTSPIKGAKGNTELLMLLFAFAAAGA
jgi:23S rRNA (cytidine1920-2'-O)/16S rRNA (cytidine1409-2'-O)-methyltransferase